MILTEPDDTRTGYTEGYGVADPNGLDILNRRQNWGLNNTYTFSPSFFMTSILGFNRVSVDRKSGDCCDRNYADVFGIPGLEKGGEVFPRMNIQGGRGVPVSQFGAAGNANRIAVFTNFDYEGNFTKIHGNHTFKFGAKYTAYQGNEVSRPQPSGAWRPTGAFTGEWQLSGGGRNNNTGVTVADFMLGHHVEPGHASGARHRQANQVLLGLFPRRLEGHVPPHLERWRSLRDRDTDLRGGWPDERLPPILPTSARRPGRDSRRRNRPRPVPESRWDGQVPVAVG